MTRDLSVGFEESSPTAGGWRDGLERVAMRCKDRDVRPSTQRCAAPTVEEVAWPPRAPFVSTQAIDLQGTSAIGFVSQKCIPARTASAPSGHFPCGTGVADRDDARAAARPICGGTPFCATIASKQDELSRESRLTVLSPEPSCPRNPARLPKLTARSFAPVTIKWTKDRGKDVPSAPWYPVFKGERINDNHTTLAEKQAAREARREVWARRP
jgi:hypothetical protein